MQNRLIDKLIIIAFAFSVLFFSYAEGFSYITQIFSGLLFALFVIRWGISGDKVIITREFVLVACWLVFAALSGFFATNFEIYFIRLMTLIQVLAMAFMLFNLMAWMKAPMISWAGVYFGTLVMSYFVYRNPAAYTIEGRLAGTLGNANLYGLALLVALIYALYMLFTSKWKLLKLLFLASMPFIVYMIGGTASRKALIAALLLFVILVVVKFKGDIRKKPVYAVSVALMLSIATAGMFVFIKGTPQYERLVQAYEAVETGDASKGDGSYQGRIQLYNLALDIALEHPALGVGLDNFQVEMARRDPRGGGTYAHSNYMEVLTGTGVVGFLLFFSMYASIFAKLLSYRKASLPKEYRELYTMTFAFFMIYIFYDFAMVSYYEKISWFILCGVLCSVYLIGEKVKLTKANARLPAEARNSLASNAGVRQHQ